MGWTKPVCDTCFSGLDMQNPQPTEPVRMKAEYREDEDCALCGAVTRSGIYVRIDPKDLP